MRRFKIHSTRPLSCPLGGRLLLWQLAALIGLGGWLGPWCTLARADQEREDQIRAAFLYHFVEFVRWPQGSFKADNSPIVIAILGNDPLYRELETAVSGRTVGGRPLVVKRCDSAAELQPCHVLYVAADNGPSLRKALQKLGPTGLLTVGENSSFLNDGGIIRLYEDDNRLRFEVNMDAVSKARLQVSAKLLRLARPRAG